MRWYEWILRQYDWCSCKEVRTCRVILEYRHIKGQHCKGVAWRGISKPRREASQETSHEETLTLDFCFHDCEKMHFFQSVAFCYGSPRKLIYSPIQTSTHNVIIQTLNKHLLDILQTVSDHAVSWVDKNILYKNIFYKRIYCPCLPVQGPVLMRRT